MTETLLCTDIIASARGRIVAGTSVDGGGGVALQLNLRPASPVAPIEGPDTALRGRIRECLERLSIAAQGARAAEAFAPAGPRASAAAGASRLSEADGEEAAADEEDAPEEAPATEPADTDYVVEEAEQARATARNTRHPPAARAHTAFGLPWHRCTRRR